MKIACIGDLSGPAKYDAQVVAVYLARANLDVSFLGVAKDKLAESRIAAEGVKIDLLHNNLLEKFFFQGSTTVIEPVLKQFNYIYLTGKILALMNIDRREELIKTLNNLRSLGARVIFDCNHKAANWSDERCAAKAYTEILSVTDISLPNYEEEARLFDDQSVAQLIMRHHDLGAAEIALKNGIEPNWLSTKPEKPAKEFPLDNIEQEIDASGAGEAFNAAYIATRLSGKTYCGAIKQGQMLAAQVVKNTSSILPK